MRRTFNKDRVEQAAATEEKVRARMSRRKIKRNMGGDDQGRDSGDDKSDNSNAPLVSGARVDDDGDEFELGGR